MDALKSKKVPTDNTTGYKGVYLIRGKYVAKIVFQKKQYFLGTYENIEDCSGFVILSVPPWQFQPYIVQSSNTELLITHLACHLVLT